MDKEGRVSIMVDGKRVRRVSPALRRRDYYKGSPLERALRRIEPDEHGCWIWQGAQHPLGYGHMFISQGKYRAAHIVVYEGLVGSVPEGLELDHLCRVPACVNPEHLEPVTHVENVRRGEAYQGDTCARGHDDWYYRSDRGPNGRQCRECRRLRRAGAV